ncbi:hypothetical protein OG292_02750 [Streptomyces sp. NBC_01511]|uniref:hypothetical protein n=1 Tax=unclassified Streptomyces TaxID=2593676 RepID=UPI00386FF595
MGCSRRAAWAQLGSDAASGGGLDFPRSAKAAFTYNGNSGVANELYSGARPMG